MRKPSKLPIDGHVIDHNIKRLPKAVYVLLLW